jgi:gamma-D-glutamyl-L-lysine dipeptidyl-peptidase
MFHIIIDPTVEMRKDPQSNSEVVSQALFSEEITILEEKGNWVKIATAIDGYEGWAKKQGIHSRNTPYSGNVSVNRLAAHVYGTADTIYGPILTLPFESRLLCLNVADDDSRWLTVELPDGRQAFIQRGDVSQEIAKLEIAETPAFSHRFLGLPYTWGGRSSFGYDCSGFVQMLYRQMGILLPRDAKDQYLFSRFEDCPVSDLTLGDLIFFGFSPHQIKHVGFFLGEGRFIHTSASTENQPYLRVSSIHDPAWNGYGHYPFFNGKRKKEYLAH